MAENKPTSDTDTGADIGVDVSSSTQVKTGQVESEVFVNQLLGIHIPDDPNANDIATRVIMRIAQNVDRTRNSIHQAQMIDVLEKRIQAGFQRMHDPNSGILAAVGRGVLRREREPTQHLRLERAHVVAESVRQTIDKPILDDFLRYGMPVALDVKVDVPRHHLRLKEVDINGPKDSSGAFPRQGKRDILIDTRHIFWAEQGPFANETALATDLKGMKIISAGISMDPADLGPSYELTQDDANHIAQYKDLNVISVARRYFPLEDTVEVGGTQVQVNLNIDSFISTEIAPGSPIAAEKYLGNLDRIDLMGYLRDQANWDRWVPALAGRNPVTTHVTYLGTTPLAITYVIDRLFQLTGSSGPRLVQQNMLLHEIQKEIMEQHQYHRKLREGSDNHYSAAVAAAILMKYKDKAIHDAMGVKNRTSVQTAITSAEQRERVAQAVEKITATPAVGSRDSWQLVEDKVGQLTTHLGALTTGGSYDIGPGSPNPEHWDTGPTNKDVDTVRGLMRNRLMEITQERDKYFRLCQDIVRLYPLILAAGGTAHASLNALFTTIPPTSPANADRNAFNAGADIGAIMRDLTSSMTLKKVNEYTEELKKLRMELKDIDDHKAVGKSGDAAQHDVIAKFMELYHNCSPEEAKQATNCLRARGMLDTDMREAAESTVAGLYGDRREQGAMQNAGESVSNWFKNVKNLSLSPEWRNRKIICNVASACGVRLVRDESSDAWRKSRHLGIAGAALFASPIFPVAGAGLVLANALKASQKPDWSRGSYENLCTAYFSLKKLANSEGPEGIRLQSTAVLQEQMHDIAKVLLAKHTAGLARDFSVALSLSEDKQKELLKEPKKDEHIRLFRQMLEGEPPEKYKVKIEKTLEKVDKKTEWLRRNILLGENYGLIRGAKLPISAKNLLYGNEMASLWGITGSKEYGLVRGEKNKISGKNLLYGNEMASLWGLTGSEKYGFIRGSENAVSAKNLLYGNEYASVKGLAVNIPVKAAKTVWNNKSGIALTGLLTAFAGPVGAIVGGAYAIHKMKGAAPASSHS